jgi:hypothetical protein
VESITESSRDLALILRNSSMRLATAGMFPRAIEVAGRAAAVAVAAGCPPGSWKQAVGYAYVFQSMQLEHLGEDVLARTSWLNATDALGDALADP